MKPLTSKISSSQQILEHLRDIYIYIFIIVSQIYRNLHLLCIVSYVNYYNFNGNFSFKIVNSIIF